MGDLTVAALSVHQLVNEVVVSYRLGVNAYVVKPVGFREFNEAVRNLGRGASARPRCGRGT